MKIPIVTKEWVEAIWETNLNNFIKANNNIFDKYKASVFLNLVVTSTNLPKRQKEEIRHLINDNGGVRIQFLLFFNSFFYCFFILSYIILFCRHLWVLWMVQKLKLYLLQKIAQ